MTSVGACSGSAAGLTPPAFLRAAWLAVMLVPLIVTAAPAVDSPRPNVVLVVLDAVRPDHLGCYGYPYPTSPAVDALAERAIVFENAVAHVPWTKSSFSSMFTSLYPFQHGVEDWESVLAESLVTLAELLRADGYSTIAVVNIMAVADRFQVLQGFDVVSLAPKNKRNAEATTDEAMNLIKTSSEPFLILIHYFDPHEPYAAPRGYVEKVRRQVDRPEVEARLREHEYGERPSEEHKAEDMILYDACIRYTDDHLKRLLAFLADGGIQGETLIILTADHGEAFWEHGYCCHAVNLYDEVLRVPLIIAYPERYRTPRRIAKQVSLVDLLPTIVGLTGTDTRGHREGLSLDDLILKGEYTHNPGRLLPEDITLAEISTRTIPETKCIRSTDWKLILEPATGGLELYNLPGDPGETVNVADGRPAVRDSLLDLLEKLPGVPLRGWRVGFTGRKQVKFRVEIRTDAKAGFRLVRKLTRGKNLVISIGEDGTSFRIEATPNPLCLIHFDIEPEDAGIGFKIAADGQDAGSVVYVGSGSPRPADTAFEVSTDGDVGMAEATGVPELFGEFRSSGEPGVFIWWLPGEPAGQARPVSELTPTEVKKLKALGYIQ